MTVLLSDGDCSLISHEIYLNQIYEDVSHGADAERPAFKIRSDLFDLNVPYRPSTIGNEARLKDRQRKIKAKNAEQAIKDHPDEYALVKWNFWIEFIIIYYSELWFMTDCKTQRENSSIYKNMPRKRDSTLSQCKWWYWPTKWAPKAVPRWMANSRIFTVAFIQRW